MLLHQFQDLCSFTTKTHLNLMSSRDKATRNNTNNVYHNNTNNVYLHAELSMLLKACNCICNCICILIVCFGSVLNLSAFARCLYQQTHRIKQADVADNPLSGFTSKFIFVRGIISDGDCHSIRIGLSGEDSLSTLLARRLHVMNSRH